MNEAKHTPGPWAVSKGYDGSISVSACYGEIVTKINTIGAVARERMQQCDKPCVNHV